MTGKIKFIPVKHDDVIDTGDLGIFGVSGNHKYLGFKPGIGRSGWLVVLVNNYEFYKRPKKKRSKE